MTDLISVMAKVPIANVQIVDRCIGNQVTLVQVVVVVVIQNQT